MCGAVVVVVNGINLPDADCLLTMQRR